jgi:hypothetical protein
LITPRRTRLIRAADLFEFRQAIRSVLAQGEKVPRKPDPTYDRQEQCVGSGFSRTSSQAVVVPTRAAGVQLARSLPDGPEPLLVTRDQLYDELHARMKNPPARLNPFDREAIAQAAADAALSEAGPAAVSSGALRWCSFTISFAGSRSTSLDLTG